MTLFSELKGKKILILGAGKEGIDNLRFFKKNVKYGSLGVADIIPLEKITEENKEEIKGVSAKHFGKNYLASVPFYDVIVKSPGIPLSELRVGEDQLVTSQSDIFLSNCKGRIIGVTGTKGKSTTSFLLYKILKDSGFSVNLIGNIGEPALSYLGKEKENSFFIYELSSFQLATVRKSPHIAIFLNLYKDHLDKHSDFKEYVAAKAKITRFQKKDDFFIYNKADKNIRIIAEKTISQKVPFLPTRWKKNIATSLDPLFEVAKILDISNEIISGAVENFNNLPHRLEYVGEYGGLFFYNDSAATIPEATIHAMKNIKNAETLILGGTSKGADYSKLFGEIKKSNFIKNIILFKGSGDKIESALKKTGKKFFSVSSMEEAVKMCFRHTKKGNACLLSPGFSSFNMFTNYKERGDLFKENIKKHQ